MNPERAGKAASVACLASLVSGAPVLVASSMVDSANLSNDSNRAAKAKLQILG